MSRYSDPNHPASSGSLISLITGGHVNIKGTRGEKAARRQARRGEKRLRKARRRGEVITPETATTRRRTGLVRRILQKVSCYHHTRCARIAINVRTECVVSHDCKLRPRESGIPSRSDICYGGAASVETQRYPYHDSFSSIPCIVSLALVLGGPCYLNGNIPKLSFLPSPIWGV
jgi:hypothetical protein